MTCTVLQFKAWIADVLKHVHFLIHFPSETIIDIGRDGQLTKEVLFMDVLLVTAAIDQEHSKSTVCIWLALEDCRAWSAQPSLQADEPATEVYCGSVDKYGS
jgi:purine-nucleoside phosphorylase